MTSDATPQRPNKRAAALDLAASGFPVFPLIPNEKKPLIGGWQQKATTNAAQITAWWEDEPHANIGIPTERLLVVDVDPRKGGNATMAELRILDFEFPDTLASVTAGGGAHLIFSLPADAPLSGGNDLLGQGVDVKSHGGFIVAPGSTIDGKTYRWVPGHSPAQRTPSLAPGWMLERCQRPKRKSDLAGKAIVHEDEDAISAAEYWLAKHAPEAVEGERDNTAFAVAARLYDFGLRPDTCRDYLLQWNEGWCQPPLDADDIERIIASAARNRQTAIGSKNPNAPGFEAQQIDESKAPPHFASASSTAAEAQEAKSLLSPATPFDPSAIPPRPWVVPGFACRARVTMLAGPGGVAKSTYSLMIGVAVVAGRDDICGFKVPKRTAVAIWNQEDDLEEMQRRLAAIMQAFDVSWTDLQDENGNPMLFLNSGVENPLMLALRTTEGAIRPSKGAVQLAKDAKAHNIGLLILDPLIEMHEAVENDNVQMRSVLSIVREIAVRADCAALIPTHTKKPPVASSDGFAGEMDAARGASSQSGVIRVGATLFSASPKDAKTWNMSGGHLDYVRLDIAKNNLAKRTGQPMWFKRDSVTIGGLDGESVGILRPIELTERVKKEHVDLTEIIARTIDASLDRDIWVTAGAVEAALTDDDKALWPGKNLARDIEKAFDGQTLTPTNTGNLERMTMRGSGGTRFKLHADSNSSNVEKVEELIN